MDSLDCERNEIPRLQLHDGIATKVLDPWKIVRTSTPIHSDSSTDLNWSPSSISDEEDNISMTQKCSWETLESTRTNTNSQIPYNFEDSFQQSKIISEPDESIKSQLVEDFFFLDRKLHHKAVVEMTKLTTKDMKKYGIINSPKKYIQQQKNIVNSDVQVSDNKDPFKIAESSLNFSNKDSLVNLPPVSIHFKQNGAIETLQCNNENSEPKVYKTPITNTIINIREVNEKNKRAKAKVANAVAKKNLLNQKTERKNKRLKFMETCVDKDYHSVLGTHSMLQSESKSSSDEEDFLCKPTKRPKFNIIMLPSVIKSTEDVSDDMLEIDTRKKKLKH